MMCFPRAMLARIVPISLVLAGCQATFVEPRMPAATSQERWQSCYLFGAFGSTDLDARDLCPSGRVRQIRTRANALTLLLSLTMIYTPRIVSVTCAP
jgi:hypothetical protein